MSFKNDIKFNITELPKRTIKLSDSKAKKIYDSKKYYQFYTDDKNNEYLYNIFSAISMEFKKQFSDIDTDIYFRTKSRRSFKETLKKEYKQDSKSAEDIAKDSIGACLVLKNIPQYISFDENYNKTKTLTALQNQRADNYFFLTELTEWLNNYDLLSTQTEEEYYTYLFDILERLENASYSECTQEIEEPYAPRLKIAKKIYEEKKKTDSLGMQADHKQLAELEKFISCLSRRLDDKLANEFLKVYLPEILKSPLIQDKLQVTSKFDKETIKENGFYSQYYNLTAANMLNIEFQAQSETRYEVSKNGTAFHNLIPGKNLPIKSYFEPMNENDSKYDRKILALSNKSIEKLDDPKEGPILKAAMNSIKIKDFYEYEKELQDGSTKTDQISMNNYLLYLLDYTYAGMHEISSSPLPSESLEIIHKTSIDSITDVLRKKDGLSCLDYLFIQKLTSLVNSKDLQEKYQENYPNIFKKTTITTHNFTDVSNFVPPVLESNNSEGSFYNHLRKLAASKNKQYKSFNTNKTINDTTDNIDNDNDIDIDISI